MNEPTVAGSFTGCHSRAQFSSGRLGIGPQSIPASQLVPQGVARVACVPAGRKPKLLDRVREAIRIRHYSGRTEEAYVSWIRRFILFHDKRHPLEMGKEEITRFLSALFTSM
jgi:Phage integrase, N-terminal SAM-like domain